MQEPENGFEAALRKSGADPGTPWLLAVSGGLDSMVLLHLCLQHHIKVVVGHCNFRLRGRESDLDQELVEKESTRLGVECVTTGFDTAGIAAAENRSVQETARDLRYQWLEEVRRQKGCSCIVTAHHADDNQETFFINLLRGSGLKGLSGIPPAREKIIRPLLSFTREQLQAYAALKGVAWREDKSNDDPKYLRNRIRHELLPLINDIRPGAGKTILSAMESLRSASLLIEEQIDRFSKSCSRDGHHLITFEALEGTGMHVFRLWMRREGFREEQVARALEFTSGDTGKRLMAGSLVLSVTREGLLLTSETGEDNIPVLLTEDAAAVDWITVTTEAGRTGPGACFDRSKLKFPLLLRKWQEGDKFSPSGMNGTKKVSDFLTDLHIPRELKKDVDVLESDGRIIWVIPYRISSDAAPGSGNGPLWCVNINR